MGVSSEDILPKRMQSPLRCLQRLLCSRVLSMQPKRGMSLLLIFQMHSSKLLLRMKRDRAFIHIHGPLVDILESIAPDIYGPYVTVGKKGEKQLLV